MFNFSMLRGLSTLLLGLTHLSSASLTTSDHIDSGTEARTNTTSAFSERTLPSNLVFAHFMVGFTANYTISSWENGQLSIHIAPYDSLDSDHTFLFS